MPCHGELTLHRASHNRWLCFQTQLPFIKAQILTCDIPALGSSFEHPLLVLLAALDAGDVQDVEAADGGHGHGREGHGVAKRAGGILHGNDLGKIVVGTVKKARTSSIG